MAEMVKNTKTYQKLGNLNESQFNEIVDIVSIEYLAYLEIERNIFKFLDSTKKMITDMELSSNITYETIDTEENEKIRENIKKSIETIENEKYWSRMMKGGL